MLKQFAAWSAIAAVMIAGGCATVPNPDSSVPFEVIVSAGSGADGLLDVRVRNLSNEARCIPMDVTQGPNSEATLVKIWINGREARRTSEGYILPQLPGFYHLEAGKSVPFQVDVSGPLGEQSIPPGGKVSVSVGVPHWDCSRLGANLNVVHWSERVIL